MHPTIVALAVAAPLLAGCVAIPPAIVAASYAVDGVSYAATGKGLKDHLLSAALDEDCALHRLVTDRRNQICAPWGTVGLEEIPMELPPGAVTRMSGIAVAGTAGTEPGFGAPGTMPPRMTVEPLSAMPRRSGPALQSASRLEYGGP